jgi:hypothetical protein
MASDPVELHVQIAKAFAKVESVTERHSIDGSGARMERVMDLLFEPAGRDLGVWIRAFEEAGIDGYEEYLDDSFAAFNLIPEDQRTWQLRIIQEVFLSAAIAQADAELMLLDMWEALEEGSTNMLKQSDKMTEAELNAASFGPGKLMFEEARQGLGVQETEFNGTDTDAG